MFQGGSPMLFILFDKKQNNKFMDIYDSGTNSTVPDGDYNNLVERLGHGKNIGYVRVQNEKELLDKLKLLVRA